MTWQTDMTRAKVGMRYEVTVELPKDGRMVVQAMRGEKRGVKVWVLIGCTPEAADRMLREAYAEVVESVMRGQALPPDPVGAIEKPPEEPPPLDEATRERIKREMAERRRELGLGELEALQA